MKQDKRAGFISAELTKNTNGGEALIASAEFLDNGDDKNNIYTIVRFSLQSYGNEATISVGNLDTNALRSFANLIDSVKVIAESKDPGKEDFIKQMVESFNKKQ